MIIKYDEVSNLLNKINLITEGYEDFADKPKEPSFLEKHKSGLLLGAAGLVGAGAAGYLGHTLGGEYGDTAHTDAVTDANNSIEQHTQNINNLQQKQEDLKNIKVDSPDSINKQLLEKHGVKDVYEKIVAEKNKELADTDPNNTAKTAKILKNYNHQLNYLYDAGNDNVKTLGSLTSGGEAKDYWGKLPGKEPGAISRFFSSDSLDNPNQANLRNRNYIDNLVKQSKNISDINQQTSPEEMPAYNKEQLPNFEKSVTNDIATNQKDLISDNKNLATLNTDASKNSFHTKYANIGTGTGAALGGAGAAIGAAKLADIANNRRLQQEEDRKNNYNQYNQALPQ